MRLINTNTLALEEFFDAEIPDYAILSHTWRTGEVKYEDWASENHRMGVAGWLKIEQAIELARVEKLAYLWVDTCCIDKRSSAELTEAINSMFTWYERSAVCFAYLDDLRTDLGATGPGSFPQCRWFTRGWTLQELLAPSKVQFYNAGWEFVGTKFDLSLLISRVCLIPKEYIDCSVDISDASVAQRMSWAACRKTTRSEDLAYCLLGIFEVNMPLLYGEGEKAFIRLQEEIVRHDNDESIFAWSQLKDTYPHWDGCFAPHVAAFSDGRGIERINTRNSFALTNSGLQIDFLTASVLGVNADFVAFHAIRYPEERKYRTFQDVPHYIGASFERGMDINSPLRENMRIRSLPTPIPVPPECIEHMQRRNFTLRHERTPTKYRRERVRQSGQNEQDKAARYAVLPIPTAKREQESLDRRLQEFIRSTSTQPSSRRSPELSLEEDRRSGRWCAIIQGVDKIPDLPNTDFEIAIDLTVSIPSDPSADWKVEIRYLRGRDLLAIEKATLPATHQTTSTANPNGLNSREQSVALVRVLPIKFEGLDWVFSRE